MKRCALSAVLLALAGSGCEKECTCPDAGVTPPRDTGPAAEAAPPGDGDMPDTGTGSEYNFRGNPAGEYSRADRAGNPGISNFYTDRLAYNNGTPREDAAGFYIPDFIATLTTIHTSLDDDITGMGLTPCSMTPAMMGALPPCMTQEVAPGLTVRAAFLAPDALTLNPLAAPGFYNGRQLTDPVMDVVFAAMLLDLTSTTGCGGSACTLQTFAEIPLTPTMNDSAFLDVMPYLAEPHAP